MKKSALLIISFALCACGSMIETGSQTPAVETATAEMADPSGQSGENSVPGSDPVVDTPDTPEPTLAGLAEPAQGLIAILASDFSWDRHLDRPEVQHRINTYSKSPRQLEQILARSVDFLPLIVGQLEARNLPTELAFLPLIESGYQTNIYSHSGAAGLWQLMPATALHLGLEIDWWYDQRLDIQASTEKALDYLQYLYKQFDGDWELAITAYNGGEGHLRSRMRRAKSKNLWDLTLKRETEDYLPRLLAVAEILSDPSAYNINTPSIEPVSGLASVTIDQQVDLRLAASSAGIEYDRFKNLNPSFQRWISPPKGQYQLLLPETGAQLLQANMANLEAKQIASWDHYRVKSGDTLIDIAREFGTTLRALMAVNELNNSRIYARQELLIPKPLSTNTASANSVRSTNTIKELYIVKYGDSLWTIANRNNLSVSQLRKLNSLYSSSVIQPGQVLVLNQYFDGGETTYEVKHGDSLSEIAHQFDIALSDLKNWNQLGKADLIRPGQLLKIRSDS